MLTPDFTDEQAEAGRSKLPYQDIQVWLDSRAHAKPPGGLERDAAVEEGGVPPGTTCSPTTGNTVT